MSLPLPPLDSTNVLEADEEMARSWERSEIEMHSCLSTLPTKQNCFHPDKSANSYLGIKVGGLLNKES